MKADPETVVANLSKLVYVLEHMYFEGIGTPELRVRQAPTTRVNSGDGYVGHLLESTTRRVDKIVKQSVTGLISYQEKRLDGLTQTGSSAQEYILKLFAKAPEKDRCVHCGARADAVGAW